MAKSLMADALLDERVSPEDNDLLSRVAVKDKRAFEMLYRRYFHRLSLFVGKMIRDAQSAEEVVDDTLFAIWKSAGQFQRRSSVSTWVFGIAYRQALKSLERARKHSVVHSDSDFLSAVKDPAHDANPEAQATAKSLQRLLARGIDRLSDEHRTVVQLTAMGHSYKEIADIVDCPANTVKTRMFYARQKLKIFLGQHDTAFSSDGRVNPTCEN